MTEWQFELCSILYACIRLPPRVHRGVASGDVGEGIFFSIRQPHYKQVSHAATLSWNQQYSGLKGCQKTSAESQKMRRKHQLLEVFCLPLSSRITGPAATTLQRATKATAQACCRFK